MLATKTYFTPADADYPQVHLVLNANTLKLAPVLLISEGGTALQGDDLPSSKSVAEWERECIGKGMVAHER